MMDPNAAHPDFIRELIQRGAEEDYQLRIDQVFYRFRGKAIFATPKDGLMKEDE